MLRECNGSRRENLEFLFDVLGMAAFCAGFLLSLPLTLLGLVSPLERRAIGRWISPSLRAKTTAEDWYRCGAKKPFEPNVEGVPNRCVRFRFHLGNHFVFEQHRCDDPRIEEFDWTRELLPGFEGLELAADSLWASDPGAWEFPTAECPTDRPCSGFTDDELRALEASGRDANARA